MTETEHFLLCLSEECDEVGQRVSKALRFGLTEVQPGQPLDNAERILGELHDLISVAIILQSRGILDHVIPSVEQVAAKADKIARFFAISREQGTLT